jgi:hypothetical protein
MTVSLGPSVVDPTQYEWLMHADYALHFLGWHLYRYGPWTLPLGATPLLIAPIGSSIGLTDSIPIAGIPLKVLHPFLPPIFQFIGLWLVLCVALQGFFGVLLMRLATPKVSLQLLGAVLIILSPPLFYRINHAALTAHWLVLAALWLILRRDRDVPSLRLAAAWSSLCGVAAATQPYIHWMIIVLMAAAHARQFIVSPRRVLAIAASGASAIAVSWLALWQSGSLMVRARDGLEIGGFGEWSTNLLTFIMPTEAWTLLYPGPFRYEHREQYEGYAYLGLGMLMLVLIVAVARLRSIRSLTLSRDTWRHLPFVAALVFLTAMALGPKVTAGASTLFTYDMSWWGPLRIFRTSGRMIWPLYYATVVGVLFVVTRFAHRRALACCAAAIAVQAVDLAGMARYVGDVRSFGFRDPLVSAFWNNVAPQYDHLVMVPPSFCTREASVDYIPFALRAGLHGLSINNGNTARFDVRRARAYCDEIRREVDGGAAADRALYIVRLDLVPHLQQRSGGATRCTVIDGFGVCFSAASLSRWHNAFDFARSRLPPTSELLEFYATLSEFYRADLGRGPRDEPGTAADRIDGVMRYLAYRMEGCDHGEAEGGALRRLEPRADPPLCANLSMHHALPGADETNAFRSRLGEVLKGKGVTSPTHVDPEGEAVWLQAYVRERRRGAQPVDAAANVVAAIRAAVVP